MGGGLIQLVAYGIEDMFLTKDPQITFFKVVYRRHTSFTKEQITQYFKHNPNFGKSVDCTIAKNGDLMGNIFLVVVLPQINLSSNSLIKFAWVKRIGFALIKSVSIIINGYEIDKHYSDFLNIWAELTGTINGNQKRGFKNMIGDIDELTNFSYTKNQYKLFIPFQFWFCKSSGSYLPLISLQQSDIKINVEFNEEKDCYLLSPTHYIQCFDNLVSFKQYEYIEQNINGDIRSGIFMNFDPYTKKLFYYKITNEPLTSYPVSDDFDMTNTTLINNILNSPLGLQYKIIGQTTNYSTFAQFKKFSSSFSSNIRIKNLNFIDCFLLIDYYFLDDDERSRFAKAKHDYIIEQLYYTPAVEIDGKNRNIKLLSDNPSKLMIWTVQMKYIFDSKDYFNYTNSYKNNGKNIVNNTTILCNGNERLTFRNSQYFEYIQAYQNTKTSPQTGINLYSYSIKPFELQTTGTFNTSQIDNIEIQLNLSNDVSVNNVALFKGYSISINIFRIIDGLGSPMFIL